MKLPEDTVGKDFELSANAWDLDFAEAIVRDCAKVCEDLCDAEHPLSSSALRVAKEQILARYGLSAALGDG